MTTKSTSLLLALAALLTATLVSNASQAEVPVSVDEDSVPTFMDSDEYDPFDPNIEKVLEEYDRYYQSETGESPFTEDAQKLFTPAHHCYRESCQVWAHVNKAQQRLFLYVDGMLVNGSGWPTSTGVKGRGTPNFDKHFDGRVYNRYTSKKFPGGDYNGLGNMPYAVFIKGGFAIHGTPKGNWKHLGRPASHGCIRIHPDNARYMNSLIRQAGATNSWVTVN